MPQLQIISREEPRNKFSGIADSLAKGIELASDIQYKKGLIEYNKGKLAQESKVANSEVEKMKADQEVAKWERAGKVMDIGLRLSKKEGGKGIDPDKWGKYMASVLLQDEELASVFGSEDLKKMIPSEAPKEQLQGAQADFLRSQLPSNTLSGNIPTNEQNPNQPQINTLSGNTPTPWTPTSMDIEGMQFDNFPAQARGAAMKTEATAKATRAIEMQPMQMAVGEYLKTFDNAIQEMGGLETNALSALIKGKGAEVVSQIGDKPNVFALGKMIEPVALQLGSWLNKGRPTDKDATAAKATLARLTYTKGANQILRNYLEKIISTGDEQAGWKLWNGLVSGKTDFLTKGDATSRFTIRVKQ